MLNQQHAPSDIPQDDTPELAAHLHRVGVERVVLLDSYIRGARAEIRIDGHTGITGRNGSGKTSMIRLLPLFFGANPSALAKRLPNSQLKRFEDYYLPSESSYIVFEYRTNEGLQLAVFAATTARQLRPVLISGGYDDSLFIDDDEKFRPANGLHLAARAAGRTHHTESTLKGYRNLVLGNPRRHARKASERCFNILAGRDTGRRSLVDVHRILSATLNNEVDERLLRRLLLELALNETDTSSEDLSRIAIREDDIQRWLGDYRGIIKLRNNAGVACNAIRLTQELSDLGYRETALTRAASWRDQDQRKRIDDLAAKLGELGERQVAIKADYEREESAYLVEKERHEQSIGEARSELSSLTTRYNSYRDKDIDATLETANLLGARRAAAEQREVELSTLNSKSKHIDAEIDLQVETAREAHDAEIASIAADRSDHDLIAQQQRDALDQRHSDENSALGDQQRAEVAAIASRESAATIEFNDLERLIADVQPDPEIRQTCETKREVKDQARIALDAAREAHTKAQGAHRAAREDELRLSEQVKTLKTTQSRKAREHEDLEVELRREGTLLQYVREHVQDWPNTISAVLHQGRSLLYRDDLSPRLGQETTKNLFGIEIDIDRLDPVDVDATDRVRLEELSKELATIAPKLSDLTANLSKQSRAKQKTEEDERSAQGVYSKANNRLHDAGQALQQAVRDVETSIAANRELYAEGHRSATDRLAEAKEATANAQTEHKKQRQELAIRQKGEKNQLAKEHSALTEGLRQRATTSEKELKQTVQNLNEIREKRRREGGVDTQTLNDAKSAWKEATEKRKQAEIAHQVAEEYKAFRLDFDTRQPILSSRKTALDGKLRTLNAGWAETKRGYAKQTQQMRNEEQSLTSTRETIEKDLVVLGELSATEMQLGTEAEITHGEVRILAGRSGRSLQGDFMNIERDLRTKTRELRQKIGEVWRLFSHSDSPLCRDFAHSQGLTEHYDANARTLVAFERPFRLFFGDPAEWAHARSCFPAESWGANVEESVRGVANLSFALNAFIKPLQRVRNEVSRQAKEIQRHFSAFLTHLDSIQWIEIDCGMDLKKINGYRGAVQAEASIERYLRHRDETGDTRALPGPEVYKALEDLQNYLSAQSREQEINIFSAVEMGFRIMENETKGVKHCRHNDSLREQFSQGIGTIVALVVLMGFLEALRRGVPVATPWMLDELLTLDETNSRGLLAAMSEQNIFLITTSPEIKGELDPYFARRYALQTINEGGKELTTPMLVEIVAGAKREDPFDMLLDEQGQQPEGSWT